MMPSFYFEGSVVAKSPGWLWNQSDLGSQCPSVSLFFLFVMIRETFCATTLPSHPTRPLFSLLLGIYAPEILLQVCRTMVKKKVHFKTAAVKTEKPKGFPVTPAATFRECECVDTQCQLRNTALSKSHRHPEQGPHSCLLSLGSRSWGLSHSVMVFCYV